MKWNHVCSLDWMRTRQRYLCASDVRKLVPLTKTGRPRTVNDLDRMAVWADKQRELTLDDCVSIGAAARGHILEPYAVTEFNYQAHKKHWPVLLEHWDDCVVHARPDSVLAYSPDAMNVPMPYQTSLVTHHSAHTIGEMKCYSAERHLAALCTNQMELEERWQIATAMASDPGIQRAYLVFFNPSLFEHSIGIFIYDRSDLDKEVGAVLQVEKDWQVFVSRIDKLLSTNAIIGKSTITEAEIVEACEKKARLNP